MRIHGGEAYPDHEIPLPLCLPRRIRNHGENRCPDELGDCNRGDRIFLRRPKVIVVSQLHRIVGQRHHLGDGKPQRWFNRLAQPGQSIEVMGERNRNETLRNPARAHSIASISRSSNAGGSNFRPSHAQHQSGS